MSRRARRLVGVSAGWSEGGDRGGEKGGKGREGKYVCTGL